MKSADFAALYAQLTPEGQQRVDEKIAELLNEQGAQHDPHS